MAGEVLKTEYKEFENFLREIVDERERKFEDKLLNGSSINIILVAPHAADASRAAALVDDIFRLKRLNASTVESFGKLVRLACVSCIKGVTYENVMAFLDRFPPNPPIVGECLKLLGITEDQMHKIGVKTTAEG